MIMRKHYKKKLQKELTILLLVSSFFSIILVAVRIFYSSTPYYAGLIWNLFLAWIPYILSLFFKNHIIGINSRMLLLLWVFVWLLFYPNAPYILTDLFHLEDKHGIPIWFDLVLIFSFVWNGLILALLSLQDMQTAISARTNKKIGWIFTVAAVVLSSFGIYLGRYLRWNSWDIISNPLNLITDIAKIIINPIVHQKAVGVTVLFSAFLMLTYYTFKQLVRFSRLNS